MRIKENYPVNYWPLDYWPALPPVEVGLAGALTSAGTVLRQTGKALAGVLSLAGAIAAVIAEAATGIRHLTARARDFALAARERFKSYS